MTTNITKIESEFGPHLMLDCRDCNLDKISDLAYVFNVLNELPDRVGMTKIIQPYVFPYSGLVPEDKGITGVVVIAESHITFHSFIEKDYFFFDIFSCKHFDVQKAIDFIIDAFDVQSYEQHTVSRGRYFPRILEERTHLLTDDKLKDESRIPAGVS
jgi:S-adenosylmethionine decarboxylase